MQHAGTRRVRDRVLLSCAEAPQQGSVLLQRSEPCDLNLHNVSLLLQTASAGLLWKLLS